MAVNGEKAVQGIKSYNHNKNIVHGEKAVHSVCTVAFWKDPWDYLLGVEREVPLPIYTGWNLHHSPWKEPNRKSVNWGSTIVLNSNILETTNRIKKLTFLFNICTFIILFYLFFNYLKLHLWRKNFEEILHLKQN